MINLNMNKMIVGAFCFGAFLVMLDGCSNVQASSLSSTKPVSPVHTFSASSLSSSEVVPASNMEKTAESLMNRAKKGQDVDVEVYEFTDMTLAEDLVSLKQKGVQVRVIMDKDYSGASSIWSYLKSHNVPVADLKVGSSQYDDIDHVKFLEVNNEILMGGVNWGSESGRTTDVDFLVPDQNSFGTKMFNQDWKMAQSGTYDTNDYSLPSGDLLTGNQIEQRILNRINSAHKSIQVYMFSFTDRTLADALISAKKRDVSVSVKLDSHYEKSADTEIYDLLHENGIHVSWESPSQVLHAKVVIIDGDEVIDGSANWTYDGMEYNHELDVDISSSVAVRQVESALN